MNNTPDFWSYYNEHVSPNLGYRTYSFRKVFEYLDTQPTPITIVETGCLRQLGNFAGDGQSTHLFDRYVTWRGNDSKVYSVDIDPEATAACLEAVSPLVNVGTADSVAFLNQLADVLLAEGRRVSLLYLDSFDVDWTYWFPSAAHHLKELCVAIPMIDQETLVVVDDSGIEAMLIAPNENSMQGHSTNKPSGKGRLVGELAQQLGIPLLIDGYQVGWTGFGKKVTK